MTSDNSKPPLSSSSNRRDSERRALYQFGTSEWLEWVQRENVLWPKIDRRFDERRSEERRSTNRLISKPPNRTKKVANKQYHNLLTKEEKQMLHDLIQQDSSE